MIAPFSISSTARGQPVDEVAIVRDKDHRAAVARKRVEQHIFGAHVQVVGWLVEQQKVGRRDQNARQRVAVALAA